jgi:hypothetical protein
MIRPEPIVTTDPSTRLIQSRDGTNPISQQPRRFRDGTNPISLAFEDYRVTERTRFRQSLDDRVTERTQFGRNSAERDGTNPIPRPLMNQIPYGRGRLRREEPASSGLPESEG